MKWIISASVSLLDQSTSNVEASAANSDPSTGDAPVVKSNEATAIVCRAALDVPTLSSDTETTARPARVPRPKPANTAEPAPTVPLEVCLAVQRIIAFGLDARPCEMPD